MPIVSPNDPIFSKLPKDVSLRLPDIAEIQADAGNTGLLGALEGLYSQRSAEIWQQTSQIGLGGILSSVGMPVLSMFDATADAMQVNVVDEVRDALEQTYGDYRKARNEMGMSPNGGQALDLAVGVGAGVAVDLASVVPVLGYVVRGVWAIANLIVRISKIAKQSQAQAQIIYPPTTFNPELDNGVVNLSLSSIRNSRDWSLLFSPPSLGKGVGTVSDYAKVKLHDGWEIVRRDAYEYASAGYTGMVPGTGWLHRGIQWRNHQQMQDTGSILLPSTRNFGIWLWKHIMGAQKASPSMYCIDPDIGTLWRGYIYGLHQYLYEEGDFLSEAARKSIIQTLNKDPQGRKIFGWGNKIKPSASEVENYQPVRECEVLRQRQMAYLDTLMCAYVDDSFVAIKKSASLRARLEQRRGQLLQHPARCGVDLASVPDKAYRDALMQSGVGGGPCKTVGLNLAAPGFADPPKVPDGQQGAAGIPGSGILAPYSGPVRGSSPWPWILGGAAAAGAGAAAFIYWDEVQNMARKARGRARRRR